MGQDPTTTTSPTSTRWMRKVGPVGAIVALAELAAEQAGPDAAVFAVDQDRRVLYWGEGAERPESPSRAGVVWRWVPLTGPGWCACGSGIR